MTSYISLFVVIPIGRRERAEGSLFMNLYFKKASGRIPPDTNS